MTDTNNTTQLLQLLSLAFSGTSLLGVFKLLFALGKFAQRFEDLEKSVKEHDSILFPSPRLEERAHL